jgi:hypothetical protein
MKHDSYYISLKPDIKGNHLVHRLWCPFVPDRRERLSLGKFINAEEAGEMAGRFIAKPGRCIFCCAGHHGTRSHAVSSGIYSDIDLDASDIPDPGLDIALVCGIN